jgi:hypothetical protein
MTCFFSAARAMVLPIDNRPFFRTMIIMAMVELLNNTRTPEKMMQRGRNTMQSGLEYSGLQRENYLE